MIKQMEVKGRPATVAFLKKGFIPATEEEATMAKVIYDDGGIEFLAKGGDSDGSEEEQ